MTERTSPARFEFRCWPMDGGQLHERLKGVFPTAGVVERVDTYCLIKGRDDLLPKFRGSEAFEIKRRIGDDGVLAHWELSLSERFPLSPYAAARIAEIFSVDDPDLTVFERPADALNAIAPYADVHIVRKLRRLFARDRCQAEATRVIIALKPFETVAVECEDAKLAARIVTELGLAAFDNIDYGARLRALSAGRADRGALTPQRRETAGLSR